MKSSFSYAAGATLEHDLSEQLSVLDDHPQTEHPVKCEYCGEKAKPSLDLTQTIPLFCCARWRQLYEMLAKQRCLVEGRYDLRPGTATSLGDKPATEMEEILFQGKGCWTQSPSRSTEKHLKIKADEEQVLVPLCDHKPLQFRICHHQGGTEFLQKYYSSGMTFLTAFPDGSAQVFYPSGLLALLVVVTGENGRVCIVYDDSDASCQPIRAMFQSDGRGTCYHSNGNIWLTLNRSGGQCLDVTGARVRRWSWSSLSLTPTPLQPIFLSLNKTIGIRVLSKERVFISFLARGQQVRFSVGSCCAQGECKTDGAAPGPSVFKEELLLLASKIRIHQAIQHLHQYLTAPSSPLLPKTT
ncbi:glutamate-rich protein 6 [Pempheris klunzingeri]|uniref:glutamate-rich protein 6 n=1 Tax=Pempheris klunzingeri TaxID=3127111 RepID=UPI00397F832D